MLLLESIISAISRCFWQISGGLSIVVTLAFRPQQIWIIVIVIEIIVNKWDNKAFLQM